MNPAGTLRRYRSTTCEATCPFTLCPCPFTLLRLCVLLVHSARAGTDAEVTQIQFLTLSIPYDEQAEHDGPHVRMLQLAIARGRPEPSIGLSGFRVICAFIYEINYFTSSYRGEPKGAPGEEKGGSEGS